MLCSPWSWLNSLCHGAQKSLTGLHCSACLRFLENPRMLKWLMRWDEHEITQRWTSLVHAVSKPLWQCSCYYFNYSTTDLIPDCVCWESRVPDHLLMIWCQQRVGITLPWGGAWSQSVPKGPKLDGPWLYSSLFSPLSEVSPITCALIAQFPFAHFEIYSFPETGSNHPFFC